MYDSLKTILLTAGISLGLTTPALAFDQERFNREVKIAGETRTLAQAIMHAYPGSRTFRFNGPYDNRDFIEYQTPKFRIGLVDTCQAKVQDFAPFGHIGSEDSWSIHVNGPRKVTGTEEIEDVQSFAQDPGLAGYPSANNIAEQHLRKYTSLTTPEAKIRERIKQRYKALGWGKDVEKARFESHVFTAIEAEKKELWYQDMRRLIKGFLKGKSSSKQGE